MSLLPSRSRKCGSARVVEPSSHAGLLTHAGLRGKFSPHHTLFGEFYFFPPSTRFSTQHWTDHQPQNTRMGSPLRQPDPVASDLPSPNDTQATKEAKMKNRAAIEVAKKTEILEKRVIDHYTKALGPAALVSRSKGLIKVETWHAIKCDGAHITEGSENQIDTASTRADTSFFIGACPEDHQGRGGEGYQ